MKKSLFLILGIFLAIIVSDRIVYGIIKHFEKQIFIGDSAGKVNYFNKIKDSTDILIFGSSRAVHHLDPKVFGESCFNMGVDGKRIAYATGLVQTLKKKKQTVFVHIDHVKLFDSQYDGVDVLTLLNKTSDNSQLRLFLMDVFPEDVWISDVFKCYSYNGKVFPVLKNYVFQNKNVKTDGFAPLAPDEEQKAIFKNMVENRKDTLLRTLNKPYVINPLVEKCIDRILEMGRQNESEIIFFTSPSLFQIDDEVRETVKSYFNSKGINYIDDVDFFKGIDYDLWQDYTHMSVKGAELYSEHFYREFQELKNK